MFHKGLLNEFRDNKKIIVQMVLSQWIMLVFNVILMLETANFIFHILKETMMVQQMIRIGIVVIIVILVRGCMSYYNSKLSFQISKQVKKRLRTLIYEKLMRLGSNYREHFHTAEAVQISTEGVEQLEIYFGKYVPQFFYSMLAPITLFLIVGTMSLKVGIVLFVCVPLIPVSIVVVQKLAKKMLAKYWGTYTELGDSFLESLQGLTTLKIYQADEQYAIKMDQEAERFRKVTMKVLIMQLNSISIMDLVAYGGGGIGIILSLLELQSGTINLSQCFFIVMISAEFFLPLRLLGSFFHIAMNGNAAADKIFRLLDLEEEKYEINPSIKLEDNSINLQDIAFSYDNERLILNQVNVKALQGITAFVGESGCGKSTITSLIMRELLPKKGKIKIGNAELSNFSKDELRKKITRIKHDSHIFAGTVKENLLMGNEKATDEDMYQVLEQVNLLNFIKDNGGLNMILEEKASNLSGGQKQRLSLARALLHNSDIYIFDETTSNVDAESENDIMSVVEALSKTKTIILISHRLANVVKANYIYALKEGRIIEEGNHKKLCEEKGYYYKLYKQQIDLEQYRKEDVTYA